MTEADYLAQASDPTASCEALEALWIQIRFGFPLGKSAVTRIQHAIARNPNLTPHLAKQCFGQLASSLAENPALSLLFLENPQLAEKAAEPTLLRMTRRADSPVSLLEILTRHSIRQVREAARLHVALYGEATEQQVCDELAALPVGGKDKLSELHAWGLVPCWLVTHHQLKSPKATTIRVPRQIAGAVNRTPLTDPERRQLDSLLKLSPPQTRSEARERTTSLKATLEAMGEKAEGFARCADHAFLTDYLCECPATPLEILAKLGADLALLARADAPQDLKAAAAARQIERVATAGGLATLLSLAHALGDTLLHESALSTRWLRRFGIALNPRLGEKDRTRLTEDANALVRAVARNSSLRERIMRS